MRQRDAQILLLGFAVGILYGAGVMLVLVSFSPVPEPLLSLKGGSIGPMNPLTVGVLFIGLIGTLLGVMAIGELQSGEAGERA